MTKRNRQSHDPEHPSRERESDTGAEHLETHGAASAGRREAARRRFGLPFREPAYADDVDDELAFHLEMRVEKLIRAGWNPKAAKAEAQARMGDPRRLRRRMVKDAGRAAAQSDRLRSVRDTAHDIRVATRSLLRTPWITSAALVILAIGIGATSAFYAVLHAVALAPMPFQDADRVVQIEVREGPGGDPSSLLSPGVLLAWQDGTPGLDAVAPVASVTAALTADDVPARVLGQAVDPRFWDIIGVEPALGHTFAASSTRADDGPVLVLSHGLWERAFGSDPDVLGRQVRLDGVSTVVVGVMPETLDVLGDEVEFWRPLQLAASQRGNIGARYLGGLARLTPGATTTEAEEGLNAVLRELGVRSDAGDWYETVLSPIEDLLSRPLRPLLYVTLTAMALVLLVGCGNVATLLIARGSTRTREFAVRAALGAGRRRIVRSLLTESLVLALAASAAGLLLAHWGVLLLQSQTPFPVPRLQEAALNPSVVLFTMALALVTVVVFGFAPAFKGARVDIRGALTGGQGTTGGMGARDRARSGFLALQAALSLILLIGAGLLARTSAQLESIPNGFRAEGVLSGLVALPFSRYPDLPSVLERYDEVQSALLGLPNVESAAIGSRVPMTGAGAGFDFELVGGQGQSLQTRLRITGPAYFSTLGIDLLAGRELTSRDDATSRPSVVVNQSFVRALRLGEAEAVGRTVQAVGGTVFADPAGVQIPWEIVGVVRDARDRGPRGGARPELFFALEQAPAEPWDWLGRQMVLALRTTSDPEAAILPLQQAIRNLDPELPVYDIRTMTARLEDEVARERFLALIVGSLGAIGVLLAATGIFGTVAYKVSRRTREIGVRVALGADATGLIRMIVGQALVPVAVGLTLGVPLAWLAAGAIEALLFGVAPRDIATTVVAVVLLSAVSAVAALVPARRATSVDPVAAMRSD